MSVSRWAYKPEKCDGEYCCGCCDNCLKLNQVLEEDEEDEEIGKKSN